MRTALRPLTPQGYQPHALHHPERAWPETNCYADLWIELLHGFGREPLALFGFTAAVDFEGDQWTFFKPPPQDLLALYGLEVLELALWKPLERHLVEHLGHGRLVLAELDSFYLPDTRGTAYRHEHVKTTVGVQAIDPEAQVLGYFHNAGYFELQGEDYQGVFRLLPHQKTQPDVLPPYVEMVKERRAPEKKGGALVDAARGLLKHNLTMRPQTDPFVRFSTRFASDVPWLFTEPLATFHLYAFNTLRQVGAAFELLGSHLQWLRANQVALPEAPAAEFLELAQGAKALQFQLARAVNKKRPTDFAPQVAALGAKWGSAMRALETWSG